jgi:hypothetical protein
MAEYIIIMHIKAQVLQMPPFQNASDTPLDKTSVWKYSKSLPAINNEDFFLMDFKIFVNFKRFVQCFPQSNI